MQQMILMVMVAVGVLCTFTALGLFFAAWVIKDFNVPEEVYAWLWGVGAALTLVGLGWLIL